MVWIKMMRPLTSYITAQQQKGNHCKQEISVALNETSASGNR